MCYAIHDSVPKMTGIVSHSMDITLKASKQGHGQGNSSGVYVYNVLYRIFKSHFSNVIYSYLKLIEIVEYIR